LRAAANASTGRELAYLASAVGRASREDEKMTGITPVALTCRQPQHVYLCVLILEKNACFWKRSQFSSVEKMTGITPVALTCRQPQVSLCFAFGKQHVCVPLLRRTQKETTDAFSLLNRWECVNRLVAIRSLFDRHVCTSKESGSENKV